jgi:AcrR family transcriptional regulator
MSTDGTGIQTWIKDRELVKQRRSEISDAAYKVFASRGFHQATMREIARAANLGIGSLYDYIRRKEDLLELIYQNTMADAVRTMREAIAPIENPVDQMKILLKTNLEIVHRHQDFFLLMYQESAAMTKEALQRVFAMERDYVSLYRDILRRGRERGVFQVADVDFASIAIAFLCSVWALKRWNLKGHALEGAIEGITQVVLEGVKAPAAFCARQR